MLPDKYYSLILSFIFSLIICQPTFAAGEELLADTLLAEQTLTSNQADAENQAEDADIQTDTPTTGNIIETDGVIETDINQIDDAAIQQRIAGIYSKIDSLNSIRVSVNEGVVSLQGEVPNEKKAKQAVSLANRVSEVVAVEDNISRTLDVQDNVTPVLTGLKQQAQGLIKALPLLLVAVIVFTLVTWFGSWISRREALWQRITPNPFVAELLSQTIKVIFIILGLILALSLVGAEAIIGTLLGGAGVLGIAVGFAVKDTIENYIASLMLSVRQPFRARDQVDINGREGIVVRLTSRATILMTFDGNQLRIPNAEVFKGTILNYTKNPERRFTFELGVDANDDPIAAIKVGLDAINQLEFVLQEPKSTAIITDVGDSNIVLKFLVWVNQSETDFAKARSIAIRETKHALENTGFSLPEPIYRLRFDSEIENAVKHINDGNTGVTITQDDIPDSAETERIHTKEQPPAFLPSHDPSASNQEPQDNVTDKAIAKARAKQVLGEAEATDILDARPDPKLMEKVEQEIAESEESDLLDADGPQE